MNNRSPNKMSLLAYFLLFIAHCAFVLLVDRQRRVQELTGAPQ